MKGLKNAAKIRVAKSNKQMYAFCDLAFKIMKEDVQVKLINLQKQIYLVGLHHAMKIFIKRESHFLEDMLFEEAGYYHLSKNADNSYELTFDKNIMFDAKNQTYDFKEKLIIEKIDDVIENREAPELCEFTKVCELKVATIATTLGLWVKDDDVKLLKVLSPVTGYKYENMLILENRAETGPGDIVYTYLIMNFDNSVVVLNANKEEQMSLDDVMNDNGDPLMIENSDSHHIETIDPIVIDNDDNVSETVESVQDEEESVQINPLDVPRKLISYIGSSGVCPTCRHLIFFKYVKDGGLVNDDRCPKCGQKIIDPHLDNTNESDNIVENEDISQVIEDIDNEPVIEDFDDYQFDEPTF